MNRKTVCCLNLIFALQMASGLNAVAAVHALFDLRTPTTGPFPSDRFTVLDASHNTRRRVNLPLPDCAVRRSDCEDLNVINTIDGFNLQPRLSIPVDGPINVNTVTSSTVFLIRLGRTPDGHDNDECDEDRLGDGECRPGGPVIGINQIVWDTFTNGLHVESDEFLDQHTSYALIVTRGVRDPSGDPVEASEAFRHFREHLTGDYRQALLSAIRSARRVGVPERDIVAASVFTTQSATAILEKIRDQIKAATPEPADFRLGPGGTRTVFPLDQVAGITWNQQTGDDPPGFTEVTVDVNLARIIPGAVSTIAFGKYNSPDYEVHPGEFIPPVGTRSGTPAIQRTSEIFFTLCLPSGSRPLRGWPVAIFGHGIGGNKNLIFFVAAKMAEHQIATIAINAPGHGFGPLGTLTVSPTAGEPVTFSAGGRGIDQDRDHRIDPSEGMSSFSPRTILFLTDGVRQEVADLMQLVRAIEVGMDVDGSGVADLDPTRIYYIGHSLGSGYGTVFLAVEPSVVAGALAVPPASQFENRRLNFMRSTVGQLLASRTPSLINAPGIANLSGIGVGTPRFNENFPLRDGLPLTVELADGTSHQIRSPVTNTVGGAMAIQEVVENSKWVSRSGDPATYAPYLRKSSLPGVPTKSVIYQMAKGDQNAHNPGTTAILRAGDLADRATFYRHDLAFREIPTLPRNPHGLMISIDIAAFAEICLGAQQQIAVFLESHGTETIHPEPARFFEVPIVLPLPEELNYIPDP